MTYKLIKAVPTQERAVELIEMNKKGLPVSKMSQTVRSCSKNIRKFFALNGVEVSFKNTSISDDHLARIIARHEEGVPFRAIAKEMGYPPHSVKAVLLRLGKTPNKTKTGKITPEVAAQIVAMHKKEVNFVDIARKVGGISATGVSAFVKKRSSPEKVRVKTRACELCSIEFPVLESPRIRFCSDKCRDTSSFKAQSGRSVEEDQEKLAAFKEMYDKGEKSFGSISKELGLPKRRALRLFRGNGWKTDTHKSRSEMEIEVAKYIELITGEKPITSDRKTIGPLELDIIVPSKKLAVEFCGLYWHSEDKGKDRGYHKRKMDSCAEKDLRLITIFEDQWLGKKEIVKSFLRSALGLNDRIFARKCTVSEVDFKTANAFLKETHLLGGTKSKNTHIGLFSGTELVGLMSFSKNYMGFGEKLALTRLAFKKGLTVIGGASKMLKKAVSIFNGAQITTWSDNCLSEGNVYKQIGFLRAEDVPPSYFYTYSNGTRRSRYSTQKKWLIQQPGVSGVTEHEMARSIGLSVIWDCGKIRWVYAPPKA